MPRSVTVHFGDGTSHIYDNVPDATTRDQVTARAGRDYAGKQVAGVEGLDGQGQPAGGQPEEAFGKAVLRGYQQSQEQDVMQVRGERTGPGLLDFKITPKQQQPQPERSAMSQVGEFTGALLGGGPGALGKVGSTAAAVGQRALRAMPGMATRGPAAMATARRALEGAEAGSQTWSRARAADRAAQSFVQRMAQQAQAATRSGSVRIDDAAALIWALAEHHVGRGILYSAVRRALTIASRNPQTRNYLMQRAAQMGAKLYDYETNPTPSTDPGDQPSLLSQMKGDLQ